MSKDKMTQTSVQHKRTSVSGNTPLPDQLEVGELALNLADKTIFTKDGSGIITQLGNNDPEWAIVGKEEEESVGWSNWSQSVHLGYTNKSNPGYTEEAVGIGFNATAGSYGVGVGHGANTNMFGVSVGRQSLSGGNATAIGNEAKATKTLSIALGNGAETTKAYEFAISPNITEVNFSGTTVIAEGVIADSASINKLTVGPDSADDAKLYFETGASTHVLEGRENGAVDMHAWVSYDIPGGNKGWSGVAYGNGKWVAVAQNSDKRVAYSTDGIEWTTTDAGIQAGWSDIIYDGSKFVALAIMDASTGENIMTSTDGVTWNSGDTYTLPAIFGNWNALAYGDGKYVAVANSRSIAYSTNGTSWTRQTAPHSSGSYYGVSYGDGQFVLVGSSGNVATSSDGQTWTSRTASTSAVWNDVAYGNDLWVAVSSDAPNRVMYSSDGAVTWIDAPQYAVFENAWQAITFGEGKFVAVATNNSQRLMWSTNAISWTAKSVPLNTWSDIAYDNNRFVAVSSGSSNHVLTLEHDADKAGLFYDGELVATTENLRPVFEKLTDIAEELNFNELGHDSALVQGQIDSSASNYLQTTAYGFDNTVDSASINKLTVGPDNSGDAKLHFDLNGSPHTLQAKESAIDPDAWIDHRIEDALWADIAYGNGLWVAVTDQTRPGKIAYSYDGETFTDATLPTEIQGNTWGSVIWVEELSRFIAGGFYGEPGSGSRWRFAYSSDGISWNRTTTDFADKSAVMTGLAYGNNTIVAVNRNGSGTLGNGKRMWHSTDGGVTWTQATDGPGNDWNDVAFGNGTFVSVALSGTQTSTKIMYSTDNGVTWTAADQPADTGHKWSSVAYGTGSDGVGRFVAVAAGFTTGDTEGNDVMYSEDGITWYAARSGIADRDRNNTPEWTKVIYTDGVFLAIGTKFSYRYLYSLDGVNWVASEEYISGPYHNFKSLAYGNNEFIALGHQGSAARLAFNPERTGLYYDGELIATEFNLEPLFEKVNQLSDTSVNGGHDSALVQLQIDSAIANYNWNTAGGDFHDSALTGDQIDSALIRENYIATVNGVGPTPGSSDIGIHGGNTQTDAGSGVWIADDLASKVRRITDTNTGTNYNPSNGIISLPLATTSSVQSQIDTSIDALKFQDSADVATVVDPKLPFGGSAQMTILHASWDASAGTTTPTILSSYGISGITRIDTGEYRVDFMTNMVNANYTVTTGCGTDDYSGTGASPRTVSILSRANSSVTVLCERTDDAVNEDNEYMSVMIIGNQVSS